MYISIYSERERGVRDAVVIVVGNGHGELSLNPEQGCLHFT